MSAAFVEHLEWASRVVSGWPAWKRTVLGGGGFPERGNIMGLREDILQYEDHGRRCVDVPEWGTQVYVRTITALERDVYDQSLLKREGGVNLEGVRARLVALCAVDKDGEQLFRQDDWRWLNGKSARAVDRIFTVALEVNGMREEDVAQAEKN